MRSLPEFVCPVQAEIERHLHKEATDGKTRNTTSDRMEILSERRRNATEALLTPPADEWRERADNSSSSSSSSSSSGTAAREVRPNPQLLPTLSHA